MAPVFIHVSKNAGTSIIASAGGRLLYAGHCVARTWVSEHGLPATMVAVVRHPYDRVESEYHYRRRRLLSGESNPHLGNLTRPLNEWVRWTYAGDEMRTRAYFNRTQTPFRESAMVGDRLLWFATQTEWLCNADGELLPSDVLRFENLREEWMGFANRVGLDTQLVHRNASRPKGARIGLDAGSRRILDIYFADDFQRFSYEQH